MHQGAVGHWAKVAGRFKALSRPLGLLNMLLCGVARCASGWMTSARMAPKQRSNGAQWQKGRGRRVGGECQAQKKVMTHLQHLI